MSDTLTEAQRLYAEALDAQREQRQQITEDLEFSDPSDPQQWDAAVKAQREGDPGGRRPCLVHDQTGQYVSNVAGQIEQQSPSIHAIPVGGGADKLAAEQIDGRFRHIEHASRASQHYARALTSAARTGVGYLLVRPEYVDRPMGWQEPRISSEPDPLKVVFDPWSTETDGSDATFGFIMSTLSLREFERRFPKRDAADFGDLEASKRNDSRRSVLVAEQWYQEQQNQKVLIYVDATGQEASGSEDEYWAACQAAGQQLEFLRTYTDKRTIVKWRRMSGADVLEESEYPADHIGIIPVYGFVGFRDGRMRYCGIPRRARTPQQAYNYHISEQLAHIGTAPKAPWLVSKRAAAGAETLWDRASTQSRAWLPYNDLDEDGPIAAPQRINSSTNLVNHEAGAERALRDIQAAVGMYQANLGAPSNESSGIAIESRKQQGEASNAHFPSHLAASLGQVGLIVMQMDARLSDTRRTQPIMGIDGAAGRIVVDPEQREAYVRTDEGASINPAVGTYGVRVVVGASYSTQRSQTNAAFGEIMRGNPGLAPVVAPFWAQTLDFPGADKFAQAMAAMAPPPVKAILQPEGGDQQGPDPAEIAKQLEQCQQALQEAIQHAKEAQEDADQAIAAKADAQRLAEVRERELDIQAYNAETARLKVTGANEAQIQAITRDLINQMLSQPDPLPGDPEAPPMDGPGPDDTPAHEMAEPPAMEQAEGMAEPLEAPEAPALDTPAAEPMEGFPQ
jgi:Phage P22-like portal protein